MAGRKRHRVPGISVYRRGKTWAYAVSTGSDVVTGKRQRIYRGGFETDDDAWQAALQQKTDLASGRTSTARGRTVDQFLSEWLTSIEHSVKPSTYSNYQTNINTYIRPAFGGRKLRDVSVPMLNTFYRRLLASGRVKADTDVAMYEYWRTRRHLRDGQGPTPNDLSTACGTTIHAAKAATRRYRRGRTPSRQEPSLSPKSIRNIHRLLHSAFRDAVAWQYLTVNPAEHARIPRAPRATNRPTPWTVDELASWLDVARHDRFAGMWVLAATTGMRRSELAGADRDHLDLTSGVLEIADTRVVVDGKVTDSDGKSNNSVRRISLDPFTIIALTKHVEMLDAERDNLGASYHQCSKLMRWPDGQPLHPDTITDTFNRLVDKARVRRIRLHDVRHSYSTLALDSGVDVKILSDRVGHANPNVTFQIYSHHSNGRDRSAAEMLATLIESALLNAHAPKKSTTTHRATETRRD